MQFLDGIEKYITFNKINYIKYGVAVYILICMILSCKISPNFEFRKVKKKDLVQYQFAEIINQKQHKTLLNYGFLDGGFYTVTGIVPNIRFFQKQNISNEKYPIMMNEQNRYIKEKMIDFVIIKVQKEEEGEEIPYLYQNYKKVKSNYVEGVKSYYILFEKLN